MPADLAGLLRDERDPMVPGSAAWWDRHRERAARRRPRVDGLTLERIVAAAVDLVDAEGLGALTVRRLAEDLGTGSASLYRHVASRDELVVLMVDHVIGEVELPDPALPGRRRIEALAHELRRVLLAHAPLLPALTAAPLLGPNALRGVEVGRESMTDAGFSLDVAAPAVLALIDFVLGTVFFDSSEAGRHLGTGRQLETGDPLERAAAGAPVADEVFAFGLETFLVGLEQRFGVDR